MTTRNGKKGLGMLLRRLFRRIRWLLFNQWTTLSVKSWPYETCKVCGKAYRIVWHVEDRYWRITMNVPDDGGGSICLDCFLEKADKKGIEIPNDYFILQTFTPSKMTGKKKKVFEKKND